MEGEMSGLMSTEKQTERWLEMQTREVATPNGTRRSVRMFRLSWEIYESLLTLNRYTPEEIAGWAAEEAMLQDLEFDEAFDGVIAWLDDQRRRRWGLKQS